MFCYDVTFYIKISLSKISRKNLVRICLHLKAHLPNKQENVIFKSLRVPAMSDGKNLYFQNSKYGSSKGGYSSSTATSDSRYEGRMRDSPNGNSYSPAGGLGMAMVDRDSSRSYSSKPLYKKERENRDYKISSSRDKYSGKTYSRCKIVFFCLK